MNPSSVEDVASCRTTVTIPRPDHELLVTLADRKHVSVSWMIREAIRTYLDQQTPLFSGIKEQKQ